MFTSMALRAVLKSSAAVLRESAALSAALSPAASARTWSPAMSAFHGSAVSCGSFSVQTQVRHYARGAKKRKTAPPSQLSDLTPSMLKMDYNAVPLAQQTTDDLVKRLLSLELACHKEKLQLKEEEMIAKVQRDKDDRSSEEVKVAILTMRIRNFQEHLYKHPKDKANKRLMLMSIDRRKKHLKRLRRYRYETFERVCDQLGITYTFPPEYYRRATRRWVVKKAFCNKLFQEVQKLKAEGKLTKKKKKTYAAAAAEAKAGSQ